MDEVSGNVFQFYREALDARGIPGERLVEGLPRGGGLLSRDRRWYDWDEHIVVCERFAALLGGPEVAEEVAASASQASWTSPLRSLAKHFTSPRHVYWASIRLFAPYLYRHLSFDFSEVDAQRVRLVIVLPTQYEPCELVFRMWRGAYRTAPRMLGMEDARVHAEIEPHRAVYTIDLPPDRSLAHRAVTRFRAIFDPQQLVEQLSGHQQQLRDTFEALARAYHDFREVVQASPDATFIHRGGRILYANGAAAGALGERDATKLVGRAIEDWIAPEDRARLAAYLAIPLPSRYEEARSIEIAILPSHDGAPLTCDARACGPVMYEERTAAVLIMRDVTERRRAELALRNSERTQRALLGAMPDLILRMAEDGTLEEVLGARHHTLRDALAGVTHLPTPDVPGDALAWTHEVRKHVQRAVAGESGLVFEFATGEGVSLRHYECRTAAVNETSALCVIRDITTQRQLEHQLRLSERMASLGTLAAGLAHEINNPLTYTYANLERLQAWLAAEDLDARQMLQATREALHGATRIRDIVRGVKTFTRPESATLGPVDVNAVVDSVLRVVGHQVRHQARVIKNLGDGLLARTNHGQLEQVLVNLLVNAAQALPEERRAENRVWIRTGHAADGAITIDVEDNGPGIPKEIQAKIFDPFFTTKAVGVGTGLGLSICHRIVTQLEGTISVESEPGSGTRFHLRLPAAEPRVTTNGHSARPEPRQVPSAPRILLIDDEVLITRTLKTLLHGYSVTIASGGEEAIRLLTTEEFDVVVCDVMMPDVSGVDVYRHVRTHRPSLAPRMIFMTGNAFTVPSGELPSREEAWLEKPFTAEAIHTAIRRALEGS